MMTRSFTTGASCALSSAISLMPLLLAELTTSSAPNGNREGVAGGLPAPAAPFIPDWRIAISETGGSE